jgi:hypothetical protein
MSHESHKDRRHEGHEVFRHEGHEAHEGKPEKAFVLFVSFVAAFFVLFVADLARAQIKMPDPTEIAGLALPAPELPDGTITVRLVREQLGNNVTNHEIKVTAGDASKSGKTDDSGRAQITGLPAGATGVAETTVDGEQISSKPFTVPAKGGIRVILIAGLQKLVERRKQEAAEAAAAPPTKGIVVFGGDTRIVVEFQDDRLQVFYLLDIVNTARTRVDTGGPIIVNLPSGAGSASVLQGSSPSATARGDHVTITGPFAAGTTSVQIAFPMPHTRDTLTLTQKLPVAFQDLTVIVQKLGNLQVTSPQFTTREERAANGTPFIVGTGRGLPAEAELTIQLSGLPVHPSWPRYLTLSLSALILACGIWMAFGTGSRAKEERRSRLVSRREALYAELVRLEEQQRAGRIDQSRYGSKRRHLVTELERIYGELDGSSQGGDEAAA